MPSPTAAESLNGFGPLLYKPDWPRAQKRWIAFWNRDPVDRPLLTVNAPTGKELPPLPPPQNLEAKYMDPDCVEAAWQRTMETVYFGGDGFPTGGTLMGGYAVGCGKEAGFAQSTVWHPRTMDAMDGPVNWWPGPECPWRKKLDRVVNRLLDASQGKFLVGTPAQVPLNDLIPLLRGVEEFLMDLAENPTLCAARLAEACPRNFEFRDHFRDLVNSRQYGWGSASLWNDTPIGGAQSDISCMLSPAHFEEWVLPELDRIGERFSMVRYHLDGAGALFHLPTLLGRPYIRCIQYVPGAGAEPNGPHWMDLYRRVQEAGRCLEISVPPEHVEYAIRRLRPQGLLVRTKANTPEEADELVDNAVKWAGSCLGR